MDWRNLMKQSVTVGAQLLWGGRYGCNNGRYGCTIVMSYIEINKAVSQWLLTFNLCVSVTWPLTCAFHIPCTHTPEIIDIHRGVCDNGCRPRPRWPSTAESTRSRLTSQLELQTRFVWMEKSDVQRVLWIFPSSLVIYHIYCHPVVETQALCVLPNRRE